MLTSLTSHDTDRENPNPNHHQNPPLQPPPSFPSATHARQLLITCASLIHRADLPAARLAAGRVSVASSPYGDSADRLVHHFIRALSLHLDPASAANSVDPESIRSSYLSLNQVTPFLRFAHLTANQAILEAAAAGRRSLHIIDFDTYHGLQWPPLLQDLADLPHQPAIRITGAGKDLASLHRTAHRLRCFAHSLHLDFQFHPLLITTHTPLIRVLSNIQIQPDETLAVNCIFFLHKLLSDGDDGLQELRLFLSSVRAMNPAVVAIAEREASHSSPIFMQRFMEALDYYTAVFESLEATLPPGSKERLEVERVWLGREIADVISGEGEGRQERFARWEVLLRGAGFARVSVSPFAVSQARLLLRLHYPAEGYRLEMAGNSLFLGWQNKRLFSVSSWH